MSIVSAEVGGVLELSLCHMIVEILFNENDTDDRTTRGLLIMFHQQ